MKCRTVLIVAQGEGLLAEGVLVVAGAQKVITEQEAIIEVVITREGGVQGLYLKNLHMI